MRCAIGITFKRNRRYGDYRTRGQPLFQIFIFRFAFSQSEPPAIIMNRDRDVIWIVQGRRAAIEGGCIEVPFRRSQLPNELREVMAIFFVSCPASLRRKIMLVRPLEFSL